MTTHADPHAAAAAPACPICGRPATVSRLRPFCSVRCADVDLGRWLTGQYRIPAVSEDDEAAEETPTGGSA